MICMGLFHWNTPVKHTHDLHGAFSLKHTSTTHAWVLFTEINDGTTHTVMMTCMRTERSGRTHSLSRGVAIETGAVLCYQVVFIFPETQKQDHLLSGWYHYCLLSVTHNFHSHWLIQLPHSHWLIQLPHSHWLIQLPHSHWLITQLPHSRWPLAWTLTTYSLAYCTTTTYLLTVYDCIFTALVYIYYILTDCSTTAYSLTCTITATYSLACTAVKHRAVAATRPAPDGQGFTTSVKNFMDIFNVSEQLHGYF